MTHTNPSPTHRTVPLLSSGRRPRTTWVLVQQTGFPPSVPLTSSPSRRVTVSSLFSVVALWSKCRQLHSRTAFTTVSWFYVALTPRRQRKQKMKRMKPTMAITFHMHALHVAATSLNQKSDTFVPTEQTTLPQNAIVVLIVAIWWPNNSLG